MANTIFKKGGGFVLEKIPNACVREVIAKVMLNIPISDKMRPDLAYCYDNGRDRISATDKFMYLETSQSTGEICFFNKELSVYDGVINSAGDKIRAEYKAKIDKQELQKVTFSKISNDDLKFLKSLNRYFEVVHFAQGKSFVNQVGHIANLDLSDILRVESGKLEILDGGDSVCYSLKAIISAFEISMICANYSNFAQNLPTFWIDKENMLYSETAHLFFATSARLFVPCKYPLLKVSAKIWDNAYKFLNLCKKHDLLMFAPNDKNQGIYTQIMRENGEITIETPDDSYNFKDMQFLANYSNFNALFGLKF